MKKYLLIGIAVVSFAGVACAETSVYVHPYVSLKGSYSKLEMDGIARDSSGVFSTAKTDKVWAGSVAAGVKACAFRVELEYNQSSMAQDSRFAGGLPDTVRGDQIYRSYMLNGYFDIPTCTPVRPYVGAGIGVASVKNRLEFVDVGSVTKQKDTSFAWQLSAGLGYSITPHWLLDVGYRYLDNGNSEWVVNKGKQEIKFDSVEHQMTAGVRYTF